MESHFDPSSLGLSQRTVQNLQALDQARKGKDLVADAEGTSLESRVKSSGLEALKGIKEGPPVSPAIVRATSRSLSELAGRITKLSLEDRNKLYQQGACDFLDRVAILIKPSKKSSAEDVTQLRESIQSLRNDLSELNWLNETSPEISAPLLQTMHVLDESENPSNSLDVRMKLFPEVSGSGVNGACFGKAPAKADAFDAQSLKTPEGASKLHKKFVLKSADLEVGSAANPGTGRARAGIAPGKGVIRERLAYSLQQALGLPCGCPSTAVAKHSHSLFGAPNERSKALQTLQETLGFNVSLQTVVEWQKSSEGFTNKASEMLENELKDAFGSNYEKAKNILEEHKTLKKPLDQEAMKTLKGLAPDLTSKKIVGNVSPSLLALSIKESAISNLVESIFEAVDAQVAASSSLISCQEMVDCNGCIGEISTDKAESDKISPKEFEKYVLDEILLNGDRHPGNTLVSKRTPADLRQELIDKGVSQNDLDEVLARPVLADAQLETVTEEAVSALQKKGVEVTLEMEQAISNLVFMKRSNNEYCYTLTLIDHGLCLPDPSEDASIGPQVTHGWADLAQAKTPISGLAKAHILQLDREEVIGKVQADAAKHAARFGKDCEVSKDCFNLMRLNFMILQIGVEQGLPLREINLFHQKTSLVSLGVMKKVMVYDKKEKKEKQIRATGGSIDEIYKDLVQKASSKGKSVNWKNVEKEIRSKFAIMQTHLGR